ncbi:hypothetical protein GcC1_116025 [Golovinomyces cichoracearum]|uniref:Uncharacterized protein n=1 Tax=Golovinomyces cichoracearum TaxID=62708 RepID=A0A420I7T2_9PEZI|nr:hypothetical protein GcC1_116025 [Golovinomyces cichoracearum]
MDTKKRHELRKNVNATTPRFPVLFSTKVEIKGEPTVEPSLLQSVQDQEIDKRKEGKSKNLKGEKAKGKKRKESSDPHKPCSICGGNHSKKSCEQKQKKRKKKEIELKEKDCEIELKEKDCDGESCTQRTKRVDKDDPYLDGTFVVVKIPAHIVNTITEELFAHLCEKSGVIRPGTTISQLSGCYWLIRYTSETMAEEVVGRNIFFPRSLGLPRDIMTEILHYVPGGPRVFWTNRSTPFTEIEVQEMIERKFPARAYWMGTKTVGTGTKTDKLLVHFEKSIALRSFDLIAGNTSVRFWVAARSKTCVFCNVEHLEEMASCPKVRSSTIGPSLKNRLITRP